MSRVFFAINRQTGERWKSNCTQYRKDEGHKEFLVMYDSGYLAVAEYIPYNGYTIEPLDPKVWEAITR